MEEIEIDMDRGFIEAIKAVEKKYTLSEPGVLPSVFAEFFRQGVQYGVTFSAELIKEKLR